MTDRHRLPMREHVFIESLMYHGFRKTHRRKNLKYKKGFIIPSTRHEDGSGIDFWVSMPRDDRLFPVQVTQRGNRLFRSHKNPTDEEMEVFLVRSDNRIREKQCRCKRHGIAFVLLRDYSGSSTNNRIAWGDIKALRYAIAHLRRWL